MLKLIFLVLSVCCWSLVIAQKTVIHEIKIRVMDEKNNCIEQPHVAVYDSLHNFLFEGEAETTGYGSIQCISVKDYGKYILVFSKEGYETASTEVEYRNRIVNSSPDVVMKKSVGGCSSCIWWYIGGGVLILLIGVWLIRKKVH